MPLVLYPNSLKYLRSSIFSSMLSSVNFIYFHFAFRVKIPWRRAWQPTPVSLPGESPWTEEPCGLQSMGSQRVELDRTEWLTLSLFMIHFKLILVKGIYVYIYIVSSRLIFFHDQLLQHHLLKSLSFLHCIAFFFCQRWVGDIYVGLILVSLFFVIDLSVLSQRPHCPPITVVLQPVWKLGSVSVLQLLFSFNSGSFARNFRISLWIHL